MSKQKLYDHVNTYSRKESIQWKPTVYDTKEYYRAFSRQNEVLIFDNTYNLYFSDKDLCFYRLNINDTKDFVKISDKSSLLKSKDGKLFLRHLSTITKKNYI